MSYAKAEFDDKTLQEELLALQQAAAQEDWAQHECMAAIERAQVAVSASFVSIATEAATMYPPVCSGKRSLKSVASSMARSRS